MRELYEVCLRCGRKLKNEESKILGYGQVCFQKANAEKTTKPLFDLSNNNSDKCYDSGASLGGSS